MTGRRGLVGLLIVGMLSNSAIAAIKVACVGDSITWGLGAREEGHPEAVYPAVLQSLLGTNYDVGNFGASGSTLLSRGSLGNGTADAYINREQFVPSRNFNPDIILIMLGTNDGHNQLTNQLAGLTQWTNDYDNLIAQYTNGKAIPPTIILATAAWPPSSGFVSQDVIGNRINPMIRSYASERGYRLVDIWNVTYNSPYDGNKTTHDATDWWYDPVHPYIYGYAQIANAFYIGLTQAPATGAPSVSVSAATSVGYTTATLNGNLITTGSLPTTVRFVWGPVDSDTNVAAWPNSTSIGVRTVGPVSTSLTGLAVASNYHFRVHASNSAGVAWSSASAFSTQPSNFVAYNDMAWAAGQPSNRITIYSVLGSSGSLVDYSSGAALAAQVSMISSNGGVNNLSGGFAPPGSPAAQFIPTNIVNSDYYCSFDSATLTITALDPARLYTVILYANRGGDPFAGDYTSRYTTVTISGGTSFQNNSTTGTASQADADSTMKSGVPHGEIFRFDSIDPGGDGALSFALGGFKPCLNSFVVMTPSTSGTNAAPPADTSTNLIASGATWQYFNTNSGPATNWTSKTFDDSTWPGGAAPLGYADPAIVTTLSYGGVDTNKWVTYYFRKHFQITNLAAVTGLVASFIADDGAVIYLNGARVYTSTNIIEPVNNSSLTTVSEPEPYVPTQFTIAPSGVTTGDNVMAVEVHQATPGSSDLYFDLSLNRVALVTTNQVGGGQVTSTNPPPADPTNWTAYNDCAWVDTITAPSGTNLDQPALLFSTNSPIGLLSGVLKDGTGSVLTAQVSFLTNAAVGVNFLARPFAFPAATPLEAVFGGRVGTNNAVNWSAGTITMTLSSLNTAKQYSVVLWSSRGGTTAQYYNRWTDIVISSVDSFVNNSSAGVTTFTTTASNDSSRVVAVIEGGLLARYDTVRPGVDGTIVLSLTANGLAGSTETNGYLNAFMVTEGDVSTMGDADADGMPDSWEQTYFGGTGTTNGGLYQDADGDGVMNIEEFIAGTSPTLGSSGPMLENTALTNGLMLFDLPTTTGRIYSVDYRSNLTTSVWQTYTSFTGNGASVTVTNSRLDPRLYYRFRVRMQNP